MVAFNTLPPAISNIQAGKIKAIAVCALTRLAALPTFAAIHALTTTLLFGGRYPEATICANDLEQLGCAPTAYWFAPQQREQMHRIGILARTPWLHSRRAGGASEAFTEITRFRIVLIGGYCDRYSQ